MAEQSGRTQLVFKAETTPGTAEVLDSGTGLTANAEMIMANDVVWEPDIRQTPRNAATSSFSSRGSVPGGGACKVTFKMDLRGRTSAFSSSVLPDCALPMRACCASVVFSGPAGSEIVTVAPVDTPASWFTIGKFMGGKLHRMAGSLGNCKITYENKTPVVAEFEMMGVYVAPSDVPLRTTGLALSSPMPPPYLSAATSILGLTTPLIKTLTLDFGNQIGLEDDPNSAQGFYRAFLGGRQPTCTVDPESQLVGTKNYFSELTVGTTGPITTGTFPTSGTQYNKQNLNMPNCQYLKAPYADRDGLSVHNIDFIPRANSDAGADEWSIVFQ